MEDTEHFRYFISYITGFGYGNNILELDKEIESMDDILKLSDQIKTMLNDRHQDKVIRHSVEQVIILNFKLLNKKNSDLG